MSDEMEDWSNFQNYDTLELRMLFQCSLNVCRMSDECLMKWKIGLIFKIMIF